MQPIRLKEISFGLLWVAFFVFYKKCFLFWGEKMKNSLSKEECIKLLTQKAQEIKGSGQTRLPKRSDFDNLQVMAIKAFFGPFPRALEAAGLKAPREDAEQKRLEKRLKAKRNKLKYKLEKKSKNCKSSSIKEK